MRHTMLTLILTLVLAAPVFAQEPAETLTIPVKSIVHSFKLSPDGEAIAVFELGAIHADEVLPVFLSIRLFDAATGEMVAELKGHTDYAVDVAFSPDGSRLVSLHYSGFMHVWDVETGEEIRRIDGISDSARLEFLPDGESVAVLYNPSYQPFFLIWDIETGNMTRVLSHYFDSREAFNAAVDAQPVPIRVAAFDISPDGSSVVLAFGTRRIVVWDVASGAETQLQEAVDDLPMFNIRYIQYDSTGERVVFTDRDTDQVVILDATSGEQISVIPDTTGHAAVSADGETLVWIVQEENGGAAVLNVSSISDMSQMQSYDIDPDTDLNAVPSGVTTVLAAAGGRVVLGGLPIGHVLEENEIFVITP